MADEITEQKHTISLKDLTKTNKKQKGTLEDKQAEIEAQIDISRANSATIEGLISVSKDLKVTEKDHLTTKNALTDQVRGAGMGIVQGAESFVTSTFGGPIGGIINTLSVGFLTRLLTNRKQDAEAQRRKEKKLAEEAVLETKRVEAAARALKQTEKYGDFTEEELAVKVRQQLIDNRAEAANEQALQEEENILDFMEGKTSSLEDEDTEEAKEKGGKADTKSPVDFLSVQAGTVNIQTGAVVTEDAGGEVASKPGILWEEDIGVGIQGVVDSNKNILKFMKGGAETAREEEREDDKQHTELIEALGGVGEGKGAEGEEGGGLFGKFKFGDLFKKGGIKKLITTLGATLTSGFGTAFAGIGKTFTTTLGPQLMKFIGPAALIAGLALAVKDGINGYFKSDEWGVSKIAGSIGGIFGGTGEAGSFGNVSGNALKWGLIGAGLGSIVPVIGTGIGFAAGALLGAVLGWIGGDRIAKAVDAISGWFEDKWNDFLGIFGIDKRTKSKKLDDISEDQADLDKDIAALEKKEKKGQLRGHEKRQLANKKKAKAALGERQENIRVTGFDLSNKEKAERIKELEMTAEESDWSSKKGIGEAEAELADMQKGFDKRTFRGSRTQTAEESKKQAEAVLQKKKDEVQKMKDELEALKQKPYDAKEGEPKKKLTSKQKFVKDQDRKEKESDAYWAEQEKKKGMTQAEIRSQPGWVDPRSDPEEELALAKQNGGVKDATVTEEPFKFTQKTDPKSLRAAATAEKDAAHDERIEKAATKKRLRSFLFDLNRQEKKKGKTRDRTMIKDISAALSMEGDPFGLPKYILSDFWAQEEARGLARGAIVTKPAYFPSSGVVAGEHPSWSGKGAARGAVGGSVPDGAGSELFLPLEGQRGGRILSEALAPSIAGAILNELAAASIGAAGPAGMGSPPIITDNSTNQVVNNNTTVTPPQTRGQILPGQGRDHGVSHFTHAA